MTLIDDWMQQYQPDPADYIGDDAGYKKAMTDWVAMLNGPQAFTPEHEIPNPSGGDSPWYAAGTNRQETEGEYWANYYNNRLAGDGNPEVSFSLNPLDSRVQIRPEEFQSAYQAVRPDGTRILNPGTTAWLEQNHGFVPNDELIPPDPTPPPVVNDAGGTFWNPHTMSLESRTDNPSEAGYLEVPNNFGLDDPNAPIIDHAMDVLAAAVFPQGGGGPNLYNALSSELVDELRRIGLDPVQFLSDILAYNGYSVAPDGTITGGLAGEHVTFGDPTQPDPRQPGPAVTPNPTPVVSGGGPPQFDYPGGPGAPGGPPQAGPGIGTGTDQGPPQFDVPGGQGSPPGFGGEELAMMQSAPHLYPDVFHQRMPAMRPRRIGYQ